MNPENETLPQTSVSSEPSIHNCRDILSQLGPLETLLGSVSYSDIDSVEGKTQQIRTSARVFKKMKLDLSNSTANQDNKVEKKEEAPKVEETKPENTSRKLQNSFWNSEEKTLFFDLLSEYGKDFDTIHTMFTMRLKKKGVAEELIKSKQQVRTFYYKTVHFLCGVCRFTEKIPKNVQELYALINYAEMRKKLGLITKKKLGKLNELMYNGIAAFRIKGKTIRVKTPMCKALRRLNKLDEKYDDLKLPTRVTVELKPKDMVSFLKVQSMAQNPRIRVPLSLQKRLSSLITCVSNRWKTTDALVYDKAIISTNAITRECVPDQKSMDKSNALLIPPLRLSPLPEAHIELPSVDISEYFTGQSISLSAYETHKNVKNKIAEVKREEKEIEKEALVENMNKTVKDENFSNKEMKSPVGSNQLLEDPSQETHEIKCDTQNNNNDNTNKVLLESEKIKEEKFQKIQQIRQGWTLESSGTLTIGELYLMFGSDSKLLLEYSWDAPKWEKAPTDEESKDNSLSSSLKKLLSLAKLQCNNARTNKNSSKCTCGHVCGSKNNAHFKKPVSTKIPKKAQASQELNGDSKQTKHDHFSSDSFSNNSNNSPAMMHLFTHLDTIQRLNPKCRNNRGRARCKQIVVERKLVPNKSESKHQIVSMNIISQENTSESEGEEDDTNTVNNNKIDDDKSLSSILLGDQQPSNLSMSSGISKILKETDDQWLNPDVTDYSLSSLLGHLDGPSDSKTNQSDGIPNDDTLSGDVDAQLHNLLLEASVDYTAKFADLAARVADKK